MFKAWYELSEIEYKKLWEDGLIVLDTSSILDLYRYSEKTRNAIIKTLESNKEKTWIPNQVALEYQRNRLKIIYNQKAEIKKIISNSSKYPETLKQNFHKIFKGQPGIETEDVVKNLRIFVKEVDKVCEKRLESYNSLIKDDVIRKSIDSIFEGRVGDEFDNTKIAEVCKSGRERYKAKIPPGYKDADKEEESKIYGDLIIWEQIIKYANENSKSVIFITSDLKEDWFYIVDKKRRGPRPELRDEFYKRTGHDFYIYIPESFIEYADKYLNAKIEDTTYKEMKAWRKLKEERNLAVLHNMKLAQEHFKLEQAAINAAKHQREMLMGSTQALHGMAEEYARQMQRTSELMGGLGATLPNQFRGMNIPFYTDSNNVAQSEDNDNIDEEEKKE